MIIVYKKIFAKNTFQAWVLTISCKAVHLYREIRGEAFASSNITFQRPSKKI